jgi:hypothetical protein
MSGTLSYEANYATASAWTRGAPPTPAGTAKWGQGVIVAPAGAVNPVTSKADDLADFDAHSYDNETIQLLRPPEPLIGELLPRDSLAQLYGPSGHYKSFVALDWAEHLAHGIDWHGSKVHEGPVVYLAAEGAPGTGQRVRAWMEHHHHPEQLHGVHFQTAPVNLFQSAERFTHFTDWCEQRQPVLIVIDTLARSSVGAEENSAKDMGQIVESMDALRRRTGACVLIVHHAGKDTSRGARGSSALRGALDTEIEVAASGTSTTLKWTKTKDVAEPRPMTLEVVPVDKSLVLTYTRGGPSLLTSGALDTLAALREVEIPGGIGATAWMDATNATSSTFYRHRKQLLDTGQVVNVGTDDRPKYLSHEDSE